MTATYLLGNPQDPVFSHHVFWQGDFVVLYIYPFHVFLQGDAPACPLSDALHPLLPLRLLLGVHSQEEWNRAGLCKYERLAASNFTPSSSPGLPYPLDNGGIGLPEEFEFVFPRGGY